MLDRRESARDKVFFGGVAEIDERGATTDCVVRNISEKGARIQFSSAVTLPQDQFSLMIARKGRSFLAKIIWWRDNFVGVAFSSERPYELPVSDLAQQHPQPGAVPERDHKARRHRHVLSGLWLL